MNGSLFIGVSSMIESCKILGAPFTEAMLPNQTARNIFIVVLNYGTLSHDSEDFSHDYLTTTFLPFTMYIPLGSCER